MPLRFLRFLSPEIREQEIQPRNFRSLEIDSPEIGWSEMRSPKPHFRNHRVSAETLDVCAARVFTIVLLVVVVLSANLITVHAQSASAQPQPASAERAMFEAANRERAAQGLAQLHWDNALANAAHEHALLMAQRNALSHQFPGEAPLQDRARVAGARFTEIAENVAEGPSATVIHSSWMHSPPHRANLLDPELTAIGIAVVGTAPRGGAGAAGAGFGGGATGMLFAVEDFSQSVASLSLGEQERQVGAALAARGLQVANFGAAAVGGSNDGAADSTQPVANRSSFSAASANASASGAATSVPAGSNGNAATAIGTTEDARKTCEADRGWSGTRPALVVRYETGDLSRLPADLEQKVQTGRYRAAAVGACEAGSSQGFTRFRVAILLF
jgi:uncharacterized protein YkwD